MKWCNTQSRTEDLSREMAGLLVVGFEFIVWSYG